MSIEASELTELYYENARNVLGFFVRRTGNPQVALDLLSETFLAAFEQRQACRAHRKGGQTAWLFQIAANKLMDHYRRDASEQRAATRLAGEREPTLDELDVIQAMLGPGGQSAHVRSAFAALSQAQREAVRLRVLDEHTYSFVAHELRITESAARARVSRGLQTLKRALAATDNREA